MNENRNFRQKLKLKDQDELKDEIPTKYISSINQKA